MKIDISLIIILIMMKAFLIFRKILVPLLIRLQKNLNSDKTVNTFVSKNLQNVNVNNVYFKRSPSVERQMRDCLTFDVISSVVKKLRIMI